MLAKTTDPLALHVVLLRSPPHLDFWLEFSASPLLSSPPPLTKGRCTQLHLLWVNDKDNCGKWEAAVVLPGNLFCMGHLCVTIVHQLWKKMSL
ncbi:hypothetical protein GQ457_01G055330 [Hibiscus cannabinus]